MRHVVLASEREGYERYERSKDSEREGYEKSRDSERERYEKSKDSEREGYWILSERSMRKVGILSERGMRKVGLRSIVLEGVAFLLSPEHASRNSRSRQSARRATG